MENKEKEYFIYIDGEKVKVSKEIYLEYMRPIWRDERKARRKWRCRDAHGVRCKKDCIECEIALLGEGATGNDLSLDKLVETEDPDLATTKDLADTAAVKEQLNLILAEIEKMSETNQEIMKLLMEGRSQRDCGELLGIEESDLSHRLSRIRKKLKKFRF